MEEERDSYNQQHQTTRQAHKIRKTKTIHISILQVMFPSACSFISCWFSLSFTTCFGLHGHLQVCRILHIFKDSASLLFFTWSHSACFPFVFCSCAVFLRVFLCFLAYVFVCLLFIVVAMKAAKQNP
jgi:hypothetical protein